MNAFHHWYNIDNESSGCYHSRVVKPFWLESDEFSDGIFRSCRDASAVRESEFPVDDK